MRSALITSLLVVSALAFGGCSADAQHGDEEGGDAPGTVQADALSKLGKSIVGSYKTTAVYPTFELAADGTYTWDTGIRCVRAPCPSGDAGKWTIYNGVSGAHYVNLVSKPAGEDRWFRIYDGPPVVLKGVFGTTGTFTKKGSTGTTCAAVRCAAGTFCDETTGTAKCIAYKTCATSTVKCDVGTHCEDTPIVCITTPCAPTAPSCVPSSKDFCNVAADCKLVDDYCGGCSCLPLATWAAPPSCTTPVSCFVQPCRSKTVACESNHCVVH